LIAVDATRASVGDRSSQEYFLKRHVRFVVIDGADAASFAYVDLGYARDRRNMYYDGVRFDVKDLATFTLLKDGYAKDRLTGYYHQPLTRDPASFRVLSLGYAIWKDAVFYEEFPWRVRIRRRSQCSTRRWIAPTLATRARCITRGSVRCSDRKRSLGIRPLDGQTFG